MVTTSPSNQPDAPVYQGQFGEFTITESDRQEVKIYRGGMAIAALSFALGTMLLLWQGANESILSGINVCYTLFCVGLGVSLLTIHIYLIPLHRLLQIFWLVGIVTSLVFAYASPQPFALYVYNNPLTLFGVGFLFAALTGIFFKEAFCFNRLETKILTPLVPMLLVGHLVNILPLEVERMVLGGWSALFLIFALRKLFQPIPDDIGDKSVFEHLKQGGKITG
ncbi:DUF2301 domain-containing membrane protein [Spirulina sp. CS-785/01]|uniref:DUF2301 domain-containing membrane protein n=1 Tax=Spirulina sp. CS-785/01 TaxID=3021716 RepID=UPI00232EA4C5|nr:DUF2301 domain-containing membrane protein [Spirulina sp. CS-785/01]MDB9313046.1 DUF2301 domain-containing membrane protein [Spirulina sp. CS-785/01]